MIERVCKVSLQRYGLNPGVNLLGIGLSIFLLGCSSPVPAVTSDATSKPSQTVAVEQINSGQMLPVSAQATIAKGTIQLEVARTPQQQATGLMYRKSLADNRGMLFSFEPPQPVSFWMKNVVIPLDMVFLSNGEVKAIAANVPPCKTPSCPTYGPDVPINQVIELRGGRAAELGLKVGDRIPIQFSQADPNRSTPQRS